MPTGFQQTGDDIEFGEFSKILDKRYNVNGIEEFISKTDSGDPVFKEQNNRLVVWLKLRTVSGEEGPALSLEPAEFVGLVHAFGGKKFFPKNRLSTAALLEGQQLANAAAKPQVVESVGGWASVFKMRDIIAPPDLQNYTVKFVRASEYNQQSGDYHFTDYPWGSTGMYFEFEITGDAQGNKTPWEGFKISRFMDKVFEDSVTVGDKTWNASELGKPLFTRTEKGGIPTSVNQWIGFMKYFAPAVYEDYEWEVDPARSEYGVNEVLNPQYVIINEALKLGRKVKIHWRPKKEGYSGSTFDLFEETLDKINESYADVDDDARTVEDIVEYIKLRFPDEEVFETESPVVFKRNAEGVAQWAVDHFGGENGPWAAAGLPLVDPKPALEELTVEQTTRLHEELVARYGLPQ